MLFHFEKRKQVNYIKCKLTNFKVGVCQKLSQSEKRFTKHLSLSDLNGLKGLSCERDQCGSKVVMNSQIELSKLFTLISQSRLAIALKVTINIIRRRATV